MERKLKEQRLAVFVAVATAVGLLAQPAKSNELTFAEYLRTVPLFGVYASGSNIYAATDSGGLGISTNAGTGFTFYTTSNGLGSNRVTGV